MCFWCGWTCENAEEDVTYAVAGQQAKQGYRMCDRVYVFECFSQFMVAYVCTNVCMCVYMYVHILTYTHVCVIVLN